MHRFVIYGKTMVIYCSHTMMGMPMETLELQKYPLIHILTILTGTVFGLPRTLLVHDV